ncbi:MAG: DUF1990 family protein [Acidothermaceae bacterium]
MRLSSRAKLNQLHLRYSDRLPTYADVGATATVLPAGYHRAQRRTRIGAGQDAFSAATASLRSWEMHRRSGLAVATDGPATAGRTVVLGLGVGLLLVVPCRVVYEVNEPHRRGFAYGTLPDHPERGEEAFVVTHDAEGTVWLEITAFSRPGSPIVRLAGPIATAMQSAATSRYERALISCIK